MKHLQRQLLRASRYLEQEAEEYVAAGRRADATTDDQAYFGQRAQRLFGAAYSLRELAQLNLKISKP